jgi:hypothetical protein
MPRLCFPYGLQLASNGGDFGTKISFFWGFWAERKQATPYLETTRAIGSMSAR